jgi:hypothetical protein
MTDVVVVVESDWRLRNMIARRLHLAGYAPIGTATWTDALDLVRIGVKVTLIFLGPTIGADDGCSEPLVAHIPLVVLPPDPWLAIDRFISDHRLPASPRPP